MDAAPGWYGKLPALGDFAQRRLPADFVTAWDAWLQGVIIDSQRTLDDSWLSHYLTAPVWRFVLTRGVLGAQSWGGILLPSVDRVGRYFPLTVCAPLPPLSWSDAEMATLDGWMDRLEEAVRTCLSHDATVAGFEADLAQAGLPALPNQVLAGAEAAAARLAGHQEFLVPQIPGRPPAVASLAGTLFDAQFAGYSLWWHKDGSPARAFARLPPGSAYVTMLDAAPAH
jgi:type VI secretion system protein ImpM